MTTTLPLADRVDAAIEDSVRALLAAQHPDGSWPNPRPAAVSGTAGAVLALRLIDPDRSAGLISGGVDWLLRVRNPDGGWGTLQGCPTDFVATVMAAAALRMAAPERSDSVVREALDLLRDLGDVAGLADPTMRQLTGLVLSSVGLGDAVGLPRVPVEVVLLPTFLRRRLLSYLVPPFVTLALLQSRLRPAGPVSRVVDRLARPAALRLLGQIQAEEGGVGSYGGDPWLTGLVGTALYLTRSAPELQAAARSYLRMTAQPDGSWHMIHGMAVERIEVTGPAYVAAGLAAAGHGADAQLTRARRWLAECQQHERFDAYDCPAGGWAWSGRRGWPNVLDSLAVLKALLAGGDQAEVLRGGVEWLRSRQDGRGSWSTFVRNTLVPLDGPCPFSTAEAVHTLLDAGTPPSAREIDRAIRWLLKNQKADGSYDALWHRGGVPATSAALRALGRAGLAEHPSADRARRWLLDAQLPDGSWSTGRGETDGTPEETGWALGALAGIGGARAERAAAEWLVANQGADGRWQPGQVCTYIRDHVYYSDNLIGQGLALGALVAYRERGSR
jgi:squalene-hopene/tetraprenyl-beta-curcumene cyclase